MKNNRRPTDTYTIVNMIMRRGNAPGLIAEWFDGMKEWADANSGQDAAALRMWLGATKPRPFYPAHHLATLWPALKLTLGLASRLDPAPSPNRLENELKFCGLPVLKNANNTTAFYYGGNSAPAQMFIVEHTHVWRDVRLTQEDFDRIWFGETE